MAGYKYEPKSGFSRFVHNFEETVIALLLGLMTLLTFVNVVLRYVFNSSLIWSLEVVLVMFAWLVLFGIAYGFKVTAHLGVDAVVNLFETPVRRILGLLSATLCVVYALLLLKGSWDYWAPFADLPKTTGRVFPTGFDWEARRFGFQETGQIPIPFDWLKSWLEQTFNTYEQSGQILFDEYSKMPVLVPYVILPVASLLILFRVIQVLLRIVRGEQDRLIVSHEAEEAVEEVAAMNREN
ncbi:TRAP transporter small permease [Flavimaricola marinus]|uniref:TRAP transporter small permease protein n=1 Tax=Flavimaricola marinus TaxID=1819565 RepID=A0A238LDS2_9RHOB|nr:TRAP transporter small permease [Flavimaricola marinus]SMY07867.1 2,3-diketo-L-gulonate TRAP transporter small permease protein YiaM [Flavimaricola marinus]